MKSYEEMTKEELLKEKEGLEAEYKKFQQRGLNLICPEASHPRNS
nr:hypothetical protein [Roseburia inulinivorans]